MSTATMTRPSRVRQNPVDWSAHENCNHVPNAETIAAILETEQIIHQIKMGERQPLTWEEFLAEKRRWLEEDDDAV